MLLLLPGRHHLLTNDQLAALTLLAHGGCALTGLVWAVTSANHAGTRRNPLPGHRREAAIEEFSALLDLPSFVYHIDDLGASPRFADYIVKKIAVDSHGRHALAPATARVATDTPELAAQFDALGYAVAPLAPEAPHPWDVLQELVAAGLAGRDWATHPTFLTRVSRASRRMLLRYDYPRLITELHRAPLGTDDGDLTATRDYNVYARAFDEGAARKYALIKGHVRPGRIVDIGCCTGSLLQQLARDDALRESDFYGIELARPLYAECLHRKQQGAFASDHVFFHQCNIADRPLFPPGTVDTFTTFSLTHELESYQGRATLERFIRHLAEQLAIGGRWLNVDVVGPDEPEEEVLLWLNDRDGSADNIDIEGPQDRSLFRQYLAGLSTLGRFLRFARDFRRAEGHQLKYALEAIAGRTYAALSRRDACEFLSKKDYLDNWRSEMHETFCFWGYADWCAAVERAGLVVQPGSGAFTNAWVVANRFEGKVGLYRRGAGGLEALPWPVTNMLLIAEKR